MGYINYKKIHKVEARGFKLTVVEWPGRDRAVTINPMHKHPGGWSGVSTVLSRAEALKLMRLLKKVYA